LFDADQNIIVESRETFGPALRRGIIVSSGAIILLGALALTGWISGVRVLTSVRPDYIPMAPDTALFFVALGTILLLNALRLQTGPAKMIMLAVTALISLYGLLKFIEQFTGLDLTFENFLFPITETLGDYPLGRMSPITGMLFFVTGLAAWVHLRGKSPGSRTNAVNAIGLAVFIAGGIATVGYVFGAPPLYGSNIIPLAASTSLDFALLGGTLIMAAGDDSAIMRQFLGSSTRARMLRVLVPIVVVATVSIGIAGSFVDRYFPQMLITALASLCIFIAAVASFAVFLTTRGVLNALEKADTRRAKAEDQLRASEALFRSQFDLGNIGMAITSPEKAWLRVNPRFLDMLGYSLDELTARNWADLTYPEDLEKDVVEYNRVLSGDIDSYEMDKRFVRKDRSLLYTRLAVSCVRKPNRAVKFVTSALLDITDRVKLEGEVEHQLAILKGVTNDPTMPIFSLDREYRYTSFNKSHADTMKSLYGVDIALNDNILDRITEKQDRDNAQEKYERVLKGEYVREETYYGPKDSKLCFEVYYNPIQGSGGEVSGIAAIVKDVTERIKIEDALKKSEFRHKVILQTASDGIWRVDMDGRIIEVNQAYCRLSGYSETELLSKNVAELEASETPADIAARIKEVVSLGDARFETKHRRKDGTVYDVEIVLQYRREAGEFFTVFIRDITERKKLVAALKESEEHYHSLVELSPYAIDVHSEGKIIYVNPAGVKLLGAKTAAEIIGRPVLDFVPPHYRDIVIKRLQSATTGDKNLPVIPEQFMRLDGTLVDTEVAAIPFTYHGKPAVQVIALDVTERKALQEKLISQDRLASIGELVSGVAHELNNPLTSVMGFSELLLSQELPAAVREDLRIVNDEAKRASSIVKNLLTFSRRQPQEKRALNIKEPLETVLHLRSHEETINNINVTVRFDDDLPLVMANTSQMQQVFLNIIVNAEQAMTEAHRKGNLTISIEKAGDFVRVSVHDDGPGITPENMPRLFTPFFTTKGVGKGTGLGLSICHGIVTEHGGKIWAETQNGSGATFIVELPALK
jgi:two-component system NtrC family sensor kinase